MSKNAADRIVGPCVLCGRYFYSDHKTRPPKYCWECRDYAKKQNNKARQQAWRDRQKPKAHSRVEGGKKGGKLEGGEKGGETNHLFSTPSKSPERRASLPGGLYSDLPRDQANEKRRALGLPALAL
jgi:hypothetical protein